MIFLLLHYLVKGGLLYISTSLGEHFDQLSTVLKGQMHHKEGICILLKILSDPAASLNQVLQFLSRSWKKINGIG